MGFFGTGSSGTAAAFGDRAQEQIGNTIGLETSMGVRYYLATDRVRPYIQPGMSYTTALYLVSDIDNSMREHARLPNGESNAVAYMPHPNPRVPSMDGLVWNGLSNGIWRSTLHTESALWLLPNASDPLTQRGWSWFHSVLLVLSKGVSRKVAQLALFSHLPLNERSKDEDRNLCRVDDQGGAI